MSLSVLHPEAHAARTFCMRETPYLHPMILGNFVQSGFCLGLLGRDLALSDRAHGSCRNGNLGGGRRAAAPPSLGTRCDRCCLERRTSTH
jgi:hypothetical protein